MHHKWFVFQECWSRGLYWQGIIHDMSKFSPLEFIAYSSNFFGKKTGHTQEAFQYAWLHHQHHNKHHWNYWVVDQAKQEALEMPHKYVLEMICDWTAMSLKFGDTPKEFFESNRHKMILHQNTEKLVADYLFAIPSAAASNKPFQPTAEKRGG